MTIIYVIAGVFAASFLYVLFIPIHIELRFSIDNRSLDKTFIKFFPFRFKIKFGKSTRIAKENGEEKHEPADRKFQPPEALVNLIRILMEETKTIYECIVATFMLLKGIFKSSKYGAVRISLNGGLGEPELTGWFYGTLCMAGPILGKTVAFHYNPDYLANGIGGEIAGRTIVRGINILKELLLFFIRLPKLKVIKAIWQIRKGGKNVK